MQTQNTSINIERLREEVLGCNNTWKSANAPSWDWCESKYRIKPQPMKVTEEERVRLMEQQPIPILDKKLGKTYFLPRYLIDTLDANKYYILNSETTEWEEWSENAERLKHHYNGGQS